MAYFVTGATGFVGRHLMVRLLAHRDGEIYVLVRRASAGRLKELTEHYWPARVAEELARSAPATWPPSGDDAGERPQRRRRPPSATTDGQPGRQAHALSPSERIRPVVGDLLAPMLGVETELALSLRGSIEHFFHLAALYDMTASAKSDADVNIGGTSHALDLARTLEAEHFHHVSSIAVAGTFRGRFSEAMFDAGQRLPSPYHETKFEAERVVRNQPHVPWRVYRPGVVVGDSRTGEMDKVDGPYYFFSAIQRMHELLPEWLPLVGADIGKTNIVPVDWVADALDRIAHADGLDGRAFHLTDPTGQSIERVVDRLAAVAGAPRAALTIDRRIVELVPKAPFSLLFRLPPLHQLAGLALRELGIPEQVIANMALVPDFDTVTTQQALAGTGFERPPALEEYLPRLWEYWEREMNRSVDRRRTLRQAVDGKRVIITGASSGIGRAAARKVAAAGGVPLMVARDVERLEQVRAEIVAAGGTAYVYSADLSDMDDIERLLGRIFADHQSVEALVNNAGRSIRRSVALSYDRFHDFERTMQLNYFGAIKLILGLLPHMRERGNGHIVNVSTIGAQTFPPRFAAYVASKAALDAFTRVVASEVLGDGVTFTTIHMPLVRTPMIEPTKMYRAFPAIAPNEAAAMICEALRSQPKQVGTRLGTTSEVIYALAPKAVDRILHLGYRMFPDSAAAKGERGGTDEPATLEQIAMATLTRGVHW